MAGKHLSGEIGDNFACYLIDVVMWLVWGSTLPHPLPRLELVDRPLYRVSFL